MIEIRDKEKITVEDLIEIFAHRELSDRFTIKQGLNEC